MEGVGLFLHQQASTTAGKAKFQMLGVFAEFERGIIRERVNAGRARARAKGVKLGQRRVEPAVERRIVESRQRETGFSRSVRRWASAPVSCKESLRKCLGPKICDWEKAPLAG